MIPCISESNKAIIWSRRFALSSLALMIVVQIILIIRFFDAPQFSDYEYYIHLTRECLNNETFYPASHNLNDPYIFAPGLINYFILQVKLFGSLKLNMILNLMMNLGIIAIVFSFARRYFSQFTAWVSAGLLSLLYSTWWSVIPAGTEVPFLFLSLVGLWLMLNGRPMFCFLAGLIFALANWVRPLVILYIFIGIIGLFLQNRRQIGKLIALIVCLFLGYFAVILAIGAFSRQTCGETIVKSSTGGVNLIYTANDKAYGGVASSLLTDSTSTCFIENAEALTYAEKDSIWKERAVTWIKENPATYAKLYVMKVPALFVEDSWADRSVLLGAGYVDQFAHGQMSFTQFLPYALGLLAKSLVYYCVLILFIVSLIVNRHSIFSSKGLWLLLLGGGIGGTCLLSVTPRYHYPFLFCIVMWAAYGVETFISHKMNNKN